MKFEKNRTETGKNLKKMFKKTEQIGKTKKPTEIN